MPKENKVKERPVEEILALESLKEVVASAKKVNKKEKMAAAALEPKGARLYATKEEVAEDAEDQVEKFSEIEGFIIDVAINDSPKLMRPASKQDAPFNEPRNTPFDEPFNELKSAPLPWRTYFQLQSMATPTIRRGGEIPNPGADAVI